MLVVPEIKWSLPTVLKEMEEKIIVHMAGNHSAAIPRKLYLLFLELHGGLLVQRVPPMIGNTESTDFKIKDRLIKIAAGTDTVDNLLSCPSYAREHVRPEKQYLLSIQKHPFAGLATRLSAVIRRFLILPHPLRLHQGC